MARIKKARTGGAHGADGTKCTSAVTTRICQAVRRGCWAKVACEAVGITQATYNNWLNWGEVIALQTTAAEKLLESLTKGTPEYKAAAAELKRLKTHPHQVYARFVVRLRKAEAAGETNDVKKMERAIKNGDWGMLRWKMARRWKERWADSHDVNVRGKVEQKVDGEVRHVHDHRHLVITNAVLEQLPKETVVALHRALRLQREAEKNGTAPTVTNQSAPPADPQ